MNRWRVWTDPIARHDFMATALTAMTGNGVSVLLCARSSDPDNPSARRRTWRLAAELSAWNERLEAALGPLAASDESDIAPIAHLAQTVR